MMRKICLYLRLFFDIKTINENYLPVENQKLEYLALVLSIEAHFPENHSSSRYRKLLHRKIKHLQHN